MGYDSHKVISAPVDTRLHKLIDDGSLCVLTVAEGSTAIDLPSFASSLWSTRQASYPAAYTTINTVQTQQRHLVKDAGDEQRAFGRLSAEQIQMHEATAQGRPGWRPRPE